MSDTRASLGDEPALPRTQPLDLSYLTDARLPGASSPKTRSVAILGN